MNSEQFTGEFPWTVAILSRNNQSYQCGGSLIHPEVVVTAAHCVHDKLANSIYVRVGEWDSLNNREYYPVQNVGIHRIVKHNDFTVENGQNDIALLYLSTQARIAENVNTICLPPPDSNFDFSQCIVSDGVQSRGMSRISSRF